jgi:hypothetical protein
MCIRVVGGLMMMIHWNRAVLVAAAIGLAAPASAI